METTKTARLPEKKPPERAAISKIVLIWCDFTPKLEPVLRQKPNDFSRAALQPRKPFAYFCNFPRRNFIRKR
ncbi:MAG: hypothetical protein HXK98_00375 [Candidatus Nanogingivalaceae bacterium]|nr:hypothetical protein [Candidatus Nanogingivalaceae bacterium]